MKKILTTLVLLLVLSGSLFASTVLRTGTSYKAIDIISETVPTSGFFQYSFSGVGDYSLVDFTDSTATTASVKFMKSNGTVDSTVTLTAGTPIVNKAYNNIEVRINNTTGASLVLSGTVKVYKSDKVNITVSNADNSATNPIYTQLTASTGSIGYVTVNAITGALPAGTNHLGSVTVNSVTVGQVTVNAITSELPAGTKSIGLVTVNAITNELPAGTQTIGKVTVNSIVGELPAGTQTIGSVTVNSITNALPAGTNSLGYVTINAGSIGTVTVNSLCATSITIYNTTCTTADVEYSQALPAGTKRISLSVIDGIDTNNLRIAYETGKVATPTSPYYKFPQNMEYSDSFLALDGKTIYFASSSAGKVVQIITWQ